MILLALSQAGVPLFEYTPMQVKQAVTGYGKALKPQMQEMTRKLLRLRQVPKPDDTAGRAGPGDLSRSGGRFHSAPGAPAARGGAKR